MARPVKVKAMIIKGKGKPSITTVPLPRLRDDYILVKTTAIALNPTDWKAIDFQWGCDPTGARVGCDYAGIVQEVGSKVTKFFTPGDRICGVVHGSNLTQKEDGAFAEYIVVKGDVQFHIPDAMSDAEAATLGVGLTTVVLAHFNSPLFTHGNPTCLANAVSFKCQGLYQSLRLPAPGASSSPTPTPILIHGGSTATGAFGIQFAKLSNCLVITTCSPKNFPYVASLGADAYFDYHEPDVVDSIRAYTGGRLQLAWDCISTSTSARLCAATLADDGPVVYRGLAELGDSVLKSVNPGVDNGYTSSYTVFGEGFQKAVWTEGRLEDFEFAKKFFETCERLLQQGIVKPIRPTINLGGKGLVGAMKGLEHLKAGRVSATKLVYTML